MINEKIISYINEEGKIIRYPSKKHRSLRPLIYDYLITKFDNDVKYSEIEVNNIIKSWIEFEDYCTLRRELVDLNKLTRQKDGTCYYKTK